LLVLLGHEKAGSKGSSSCTCTHFFLYICLICCMFFGLNK
jgi:hypothetical protein